MTSTATGTTPSALIPKQPATTTRHARTIGLNYSSSPNAEQESGGVEDVVRPDRHQDPRGEVIDGGPPAENVDGRRGGAAALRVHRQSRARRIEAAGEVSEGAHPDRVAECEDPILRDHGPDDLRG